MPWRDCSPTEASFCQDSTLHATIRLGWKLRVTHEKVRECWQPAFAEGREESSLKNRIPLTKTQRESCLMREPTARAEQWRSGWPESLALVRQSQGGCRLFFRCRCLVPVLFCDFSEGVWLLDGLLLLS